MRAKVLLAIVGIVVAFGICQLAQANLIVGGDMGTVSGRSDLGGAWNSTTSYDLYGSNYGLLGGSNPGSVVSSLPGIFWQCQSGQALDLYQSVTLTAGTWQLAAQATERNYTHVPPQDASEDVNADGTVGNLSMSLYAGALNTTAGFNGATPIAPSSAVGNWATLSNTITDFSNTYNSLSAGVYTIRFAVDWNGANLYQAGVDNVSMNLVTPAPEPSMVVLLVSGLLGLLCYAWRKRR